ncbi:cyclin-dependent kinase inhibitor 3 [Salarias fasciatus]|uniref:Cyclin-dependent kinase inhibitor 3 n=1 Tax=Salarias fasciatus TaxID=181472 RepID=A0A672ILN3_SALFA|nr:cyclin-dependent kinase inhibitor 3 [Salarias fasciatus]
MAASTRQDNFDSSSDEDIEEQETPFLISWLHLSIIECSQSLGICGLPGCKYKEIRRNMTRNLDEMQNQGVQDVFVFCSRGELVKYRVPSLLELYQRRGFRVHHKPILDGDAPTLEYCCEILDDLRECLEEKRRTVIHCYAGLGRSALIAACLLLQLSLLLTPSEVIEILRDLRGGGAVQTVKQYNFIHEFRSNYAEYLESRESSSERSVSR